MIQDDIKLHLRLYDPGCMACLTLRDTGQKGTEKIINTRLGRTDLNRG